MDTNAAVEFLRDNHRSVLLTWRRDGSPQLSPVVHAVDGDGRVMISTRRPTAKAKNLTRDPRAAMCTLNDGFFGAWLQITGTAEVVSLPEAMPLLEDIYRQVAGEHPDWDDFRTAMAREERVCVRITIEHAAPDPAS